MGMTHVTVHRSMFSNAAGMNWTEDLDAAHDWLITHVGKERGDWHWNTIEPHCWSVAFIDPNKAMLFRLTWG
jgi:hypothetical protein